LEGVCGSFINTGADGYTAIHTGKCTVKSLIFSYSEKH